MAIWLSDEMFFHSEDELKLYAAVGLYMIAWASLENGLNESLHIIFDRLDGEQIEKEMPRTLQRRLSFLTRAAARIPEFTAEDVANVKKLCTKVSEASQFRHDLAHGMNTNLFKAEPPSLEMLRSKDASKSMWSGEPSRVDLSIIIERYAVLQNLIYNAIVTCRRISDAVVARSGQSPSTIS